MARWQVAQTGYTPLFIAVGKLQIQGISIP
jgi:hypothetical protein